MYTPMIHLDFYDVLPEILSDINSADYVAIDGEFTGILPFNQMNYFDTPAERYQRHYDVISFFDYLKYLKFHRIIYFSVIGII